MRISFAVVVCDQGGGPAGRADRAPDTGLIIEAPARWQGPPALAVSFTVSFGPDRGRPGDRINRLPGSTARGEGPLAVGHQVDPPQHRIRLGAEAAHERVPRPALPVDHADGLLVIRAGQGRLA